MTSQDAGSKPVPWPAEPYRAKHGQGTPDHTVPRPMLRVLHIHIGDVLWVSSSTGLCQRGRKPPLETFVVGFSESAEQQSERERLRRTRVYRGYCCSRNVSISNVLHKHRFRDLPVSHSLHRDTPMATPPFLASPEPNPTSLSWRGPGMAWSAVGAPTRSVAKSH